MVGQVARIPGLGDCAFSAGGVDVTVVQGSAYLALSTQSFDPRGIGVLQQLAALVLPRIH